MQLCNEYNYANDADHAREHNGHHHPHAQLDSLVSDIEACIFWDQALDGKHMTFFSRKMHGSPPVSAAKTWDIMPLIQPLKQTQTQQQYLVNQTNYTVTLWRMQLF